MCTNLGCCPPGGMPYDPASHPLAAHATVAGLVALPDRNDLATHVTPVTGAARHAMRHATGQAIRRLENLAAQATDAEQLAARLRQAGCDAVRHAFNQPGMPLSDEQAAWLSVLLAHIPVRDYAWAHTNNAAGHMQLWADLTRRAEPDFVDAPASLLAFAAWRRGRGPLANLAVDRALAAYPDYRMAKLLRTLLSNGTPPHSLNDWPTLATQTVTEPTADQRAQPAGGGTDDR